MPVRRRNIDSGRRNVRKRSMMALAMFAASTPANMLISPIQPASCALTPKGCRNCEKKEITDHELPRAIPMARVTTASGKFANPTLSFLTVSRYDPPHAAQLMLVGR